MRQQAAAPAEHNEQRPWEAHRRARDTIEVQEVANAAGDEAVHQPEDDIDHHVNGSVTDELAALFVLLFDTAANRVLVVAGDIFFAPPFGVQGAVFPMLELLAELVANVA